MMLMMVDSMGRNSTLDSGLKRAVNGENVFDHLITPTFSCERLALGIVRWMMFSDPALIRPFGCPLPIRSVSYLTRMETPAAISRLGDQRSGLNDLRQPFCE
jgi:hypothetical protein